VKLVARYWLLVACCWLLVAVPKGQMKIAQRFIFGNEMQAQIEVPKGTIEKNDFKCHDPRVLIRPFGTCEIFMDIVSHQ
jgi:hypothetical protein